MAIIWVNKSGNDANDGKSPNTAKLTIQAAVDAATQNGDMIIIQSGVYNESVVLPHERYLIFKGDGLVILDGQNTLINGIANLSGWTHVDCRNLIIMNYTNMGIYTNALLATVISNCMILNCGLGIRVADWVTIEKTIIANCTTGFQCTGGSTSTNLTIANCSTGINISYGSVTNSIIYNCATLVNRSGTPTLNKNIYYPVGASNVLVNAGNTYTDIASWRTATGQDANSDVVDPLFLDVNNLLFSVANNSPAINLSLNPPTNPQPYPFVGIGAVNRRIGVSNNINNTTIWDLATLTNVVKDSDGSYKLVDPNTDGTIEFPEMDLQTLSGFTPSAGQTLGIKLTDLTQSISYPQRVIDSTVGDSRPNRLTYQIRYSNTSPITTNYVDFEPGQLINVAGRFIQIKVTLKATGVAG